MSILPYIICFHLSVSLRLMQGSGQPSCVIDSKVIHDLAVEATPSVLHLYDCMYVCVREGETGLKCVCVHAVKVAAHIKTF